MQLRTEPIFEAFDSAVGLIEDAGQRELFARVVAASRPAVERATTQLVGEVVQEIDEALGEEARVVLTYEPEGVSVSVTRAEPVESGEGLGTLGDDVERVTLRMPAGVKEQASGFAAEAAMSLNTWIVRSVGRALAREAERGSGRRSEGRGRRGRRGGGSLRGQVGL